MLSSLKSYVSKMPTGMVSLFIPYTPDLSKWKSFTTNEIAQASNIKDAQNRKIVQSSLRAVDSYIAGLKRLPANGLAMFSGSCI